jgi:hypothetical protein
MADLAVTIGADTTELEKKAKSAGKTLEKELGKKGNGAMAGIDFAQNLMSGNIGSAIGSLFGPVGQGFGALIDTILGKLDEAMQRAREFKLISLQTGLSVSKIQELEAVSKASGVSLNKLADSISEYNRRIGYARTHGSEMNYLLTKMGVSFETIKNGSFDYFQAIEALRKAQAAGTDEAILNHYAQVMLGSSYKELLPLMKIGSESIKQQSNDIESASEDSINALTKLKSYTEVFFINLGNAIMEMMGRLAKRFQTDASSAGKAILSEYEDSADPEKAIEAGINKIGYGVTAEQRGNLMGDAIDKLFTDGKISKELRKKLFDQLDTRIPIDANVGKNLNPFGAGPALGASQMQQMGGGDLFGAVTFNPQQETANNTKITADQITQLNSKVQPSTTANPEREGLEK